MVRILYGLNTFNIDSSLIYGVKAIAGGSCQYAVRQIMSVRICRHGTHLSPLSPPSL